MIIKQICLENFGKFHNKTIEFYDGLNLLYGENEAGKTTLHTFIRAMLFGLEGAGGREEKDAYGKYLPDENAGIFGGSMMIEAGGKEYLIERNFSRAARSLKITCLDTGAVLNQKETDRLFEGFDENCYYNTISIGQLGSIAGKELAGVLETYASNLGSAKTADINIDEAFNQLNDISEKLSAAGEMDQKAAVEDEAAALKDEIEACRREEDRLIKDIEDARTEEADCKAGEDALIEKDKAQTDRQMKKNIMQEDMMEESAALTSEIERLRQEKESSDRHKNELKAQLDRNKVTDRQSVNREIERVASKSNVSWVCILIIAAAFGLCAGNYFSGSSYPLFQAACLCVAGFFAVLFVILYFVKKKRKAKKQLMLQKLKITADRYEAANGESDYIQKQIDEKQSEQSSLSLRIQSEQSKSEELSDYSQEIEEIREKSESIRERKENAQRALEEERTKELKFIAKDRRLRFKLAGMERTQTDLDAIEQARVSISAIVRDVRESFGKDVNDKASVYLKNITDGKYDLIRVDDDFQITIRDVQGRELPLSRLSRGTIEQIYLSLRLAAADIIFKRDKKPILLDDALVMYDNKRMARALRFMAENLEQVILFSCHTREKVMADRLGIPYHFSMI